MPSRVLTIVCMSLFAVSALGSRVHAEERTKEAPQGVVWMKRIDAALARAKEQKKPVLVFCYAWHSSAAQHLKKKVWSDARVAAALARSFVPLFLNPDAIDSEQSGNGAQSRFGIRMLPTHLVLDAAGRVLITERGLPAPNPAKMIAWIQARAQDVENHRRLEQAVRTQPKKAGPKIELLQLRLELATRLGVIGGHIVVHPAPDSARNRQIDAVVREAEALATELEQAKSPNAWQAQAIWGQAALAAGVERKAALARLDKVIDDLARAANPAGATVAFNTAYALFEKDPTAARPYLTRLIETWPKSKPYWKARVYVAYSYGRAGEKAKARTLYEAIVKEGPSGDRWVASARETLRQMDAWERRQKRQ